MSDATRLSAAHHRASSSSSGSFLAPLRSCRSLQHYIKRMLTKLTVYDVMYSNASAFLTRNGHGGNCSQTASLLPNNFLLTSFATSVPKNVTNRFSVQTKNVPLNATSWFSRTTWGDVIHVPRRMLFRNVMYVTFRFSVQLPSTEKTPQRRGGVTTHARSASTLLRYVDRPHRAWENRNATRPSSYTVYVVPQFTSRTNEVSSWKHASLVTRADQSHRSKAFACLSVCPQHNATRS